MKKILALGIMVVLVWSVGLTVAHGQSGDSQSEEGQSEEYVVIDSFGFTLVEGSKWGYYIPPGSIVVYSGPRFNGITTVYLSLITNTSIAPAPYDSV